MKALDILIVDAGDGVFGSSLPTLLCTSGHRAKCISGVSDASEDLFGWGDYDSLVIDPKLPGALELAKKAEESFPGLKIIFLEKPVNFEALRAQLEAHVNPSRGICS